MCSDFVSSVRRGLVPLFGFVSVLVVHSAILEEYISHSIVCVNLLRGGAIYSVGGYEKIVSQTCDTSITSDVSKKRRSIR